MTIDEKKFLSSMGYNVELEGSIFFFDLLSDVRTMLEEEKSVEEIKEELPKYYIDYAHFDYEVGQNFYQDALNKFCQSRIVDENNARINQEVLGNQENMGVEDTLLFFGKFFNDQDAKDKRNSGLRR